MGRQGRVLEMVEVQEVFLDGVFVLIESVPVFAGTWVEIGLGRRRIMTHLGAGALDDLP